MQRIRLIENRTGEYLGLDLFASSVPSGHPQGQTLTLFLADDVVRQFFIDGPGEFVFAQDGREGLIGMSHVDLVVTETMDSRIRHLERVQQEQS